MRITETKINGIQNPMGFTYDFLLCSWKVEDTESKKQVHAKIEVSEDAEFSQVLWEKEGEDLKQSGEKIDLELKPEKCSGGEADLTSTKMDAFHRVIGQ